VERVLALPQPLRADERCIAFVPGGVVSSDNALGLMKQLLWNVLVVSTPVLAAALLIGLLISVLQVATQLQEMTLSYIPKMLVVVLVLMALGPWMLHRITQFAILSFKLIPSLG